MKVFKGEKRDRGTERETEIQGKPERQGETELER